MPAAGANVNLAPLCQRARLLLPKPLSSLPPSPSHLFPAHAAPLLAPRHCCRIVPAGPYKGGLRFRGGPDGVNLSIVKFLGFEQVIPGLLRVGGGRVAAVGYSGGGGGGHDNLARAAACALPPPATARLRLPPAPASGV